MKFIKVTDTHYGHSNRTHKIHEKFLNRMAAVIQKEKVDAVIHAGDWISCNQHQLPRTWKMFRKHLGDIPIYTVTGNHDLWNMETFGVNAKKRVYAKVPVVTLGDMRERQKEWAEEHNIWLLQQHPIEKDDLVIYGFNGWYGMPTESNDKRFMPRMVESCPTGVYLQKEAYDELDTCMEMAKWQIGKKKMLVTHMPPHDKRLGENMLESMNAPARWMPFMAETFDVVCFGHTHWFVDTEIDGCRFINSGTDYDNYRHGYDAPQFYIFEI